MKTAHTQNTLLPSKFSIDTVSNMSLDVERRHFKPYVEFLI